MARGRECDIPLLSDWIARTSHLPNAGVVVAWVTLRLVTKESHRVPEAVSQGYILARFLLPIPNPRLFHFVVGQAAYGIEPLDDLRKADVASVQQIAFRGSGQVR
jgi:hypothetical protein